jgi:hypothetical protein
MESFFLTSLQRSRNESNRNGLNEREIEKKKNCHQKNVVWYYCQEKKEDKENGCKSIRKRGKTMSGTTHL